MLSPDRSSKLTFSVDGSSVVIQSEVVRMDMGIGAAIKFSESTHEVRATLHRSSIWRRGGGGGGGEDALSLEGKTMGDAARTQPLTRSHYET